MPRPRSGSVFQSSGRWFARITLTDSSDRPAIALPTCQTKSEADARATALSEIADKLRKAGRLDIARTYLDAAASAVDTKALEQVLRNVDLVCLGRAPNAKLPTIRELGEAWTRGDLARDYPDHVRVKRSVGHDVGRLENYVYPIVGDLRIDAFTLDHARTVMRGITTGRTVATRRHVAQLLNRICKMAVFPLQLIETNPLPSGFLPKIGPGKAKAWVYPDEDATLVASPNVALEYRVFYGFLHREGPRVNEAARLTWSDFDLDRGSVVLDVNKTNDPRAWALSPGVARGLQAWRAFLSHYGVSTNGSDFVFVDLHGEQVNVNHTAAKYREHLLAAGIDRAVLFERTETRQQIRAHDTRATFVTVSLANGKSEAWVQDRTGHKSSLMINRYRRAARTAAELHLGDFTPLDEAIPELARLLTAESATAKTPRSTDETSAADPRILATETATPARIVSGIVSNLEPEAPDAPESDVENLMISSGGPSRTRTGTLVTARDFKTGWAYATISKQHQTRGFRERFTPDCDPFRRFTASVRRFKLGNSPRIDEHLRFLRFVGDEAVSS